MAYSTGEYDSSGRSLTIGDIQAGAKPIPTTYITPKPATTTTVAPKPAYTATNITFPTYGGGGGTVSPPAPVQAQPQAPLATASAEALKAQLKALEAQYGLSVQQLVNAGGEIGAQAQFMLSQLEQQQKVEQRSLFSNLLQRGVFRSGITARDLAAMAGQFADQSAQVEVQKANTLRDLELQRQQAQAQFDAGIGQVRGEIETGNLPVEIQQALTNQLEGITIDDLVSIEDLLALIEKGRGGMPGSGDLGDQGAFRVSGSIGA